MMVNQSPGSQQILTGLSRSSQHSKYIHQFLRWLTQPVGLTMIHVQEAVCVPKRCTSQQQELIKTLITIHHYKGLLTHRRQALFMVNGGYSSLNKASIASSHYPLQTCGPGPMVSASPGVEVPRVRQLDSIL